VVPGRNPDLSALEAEPQKTGGGAGKTVLALVLPLLLMGVAGAATARPTRLLEFLALLLFVACGAALMTGYERFSGDWRSVFLAAGLGGAVALGLVRTVRKEGFMVFGLSKEGIAGRGLAGALILTVLAAGLLVGMAILTESFRAKGFQGGRALHYLGKSALQQVALCLFLSASLHRVCGNRRSAAAVLAAFLFSAFHLPNFTVCAGAFLVAVGWAYLYLRWRALLPVIASHAILGSMLALLVSEPLLLSHRMGWAFFR